MAYNMGLPEELKHAVEEHGRVVLKETEEHGTCVLLRSIVYRTVRCLPDTCGAPAAIVYRHLRVNAELSVYKDVHIPLVTAEIVLSTIYVQYYNSWAQVMMTVYVMPFLPFLIGAIVEKGWRIHTMIDGNVLKVLRKAGQVFMQMLAGVAS